MPEQTTRVTEGQAHGPKAHMSPNLRMRAMLVTTVGQLRQPTASQGNRVMAGMGGRVRYGGRQDLQGVTRRTAGNTTLQAGAGAQWGWQLGEEAGAEARYCVHWLAHPPIIQQLALHTKPSHHVAGVAADISKAWRVTGGRRAVP